MLRTIAAWLASSLRLEPPSFAQAFRYPDPESSERMDGQWQNGWPKMRLTNPIWHTARLGYLAHNVALITAEIAVKKYPVVARNHRVRRALNLEV